MKYPIGIQSFESLINGNYVYVDKTRHIYDMANSGSYYFLSRPRRFGKSLLLSTMKAYFEGRSELFRGLAIEDLEHDWAEHPVLYLDFNAEEYKQHEGLRRKLDFFLSGYEAKYGCPARADLTLSSRFISVIRRAAEQTGHKVVILVDEYDKPLLETAGNKRLHEENLDLLKAFYSALKSEDCYIRFALLTGVTKFSHVSIFSDLNNLKDISMLPKYADICGITEAELHYYFTPEVAGLARKCNLGQEECYTELAKMYDGYHFAIGGKGVYNPFSLLQTLQDEQFGSYWYASGTPTFLVRLMEQSQMAYQDVTEQPVTEEVLNSTNNMMENPVPVLYQSGYLTLKSYDADFHTYRLDYPNEEVKRGFFNFLLPTFVPAKRNSTAFYIENFVCCIRQGKVEEFMERLTDFFDSGDYRVAGIAELYFQNSLYVLFKLLGFHTEVETATSRGRIDLTIKTDKYIYVMELKLDGTADEALKQIDDRGYHLKYSADGRTVIKLGVVFSSKTRTVAEYKTAPREL